MEKFFARFPMIGKKFRRKGRAREAQGENAKNAKGGTQRAQRRGAGGTWEEGGPGGCGILPRLRGRGAEGKSGWGASEEGGGVGKLDGFDVIDGFDAIDGFGRGTGAGGGGNFVLDGVEQVNAEEGEEDEEDGEACLAGGAIGADLREVAAEEVAMEEEGEKARQQEAHEETEPQVCPRSMLCQNGLQQLHVGGRREEQNPAEAVQKGQEVAAGLVEGDGGHEGEVAGGFRGHGALLFSAGAMKRERRREVKGKSGREEGGRGAVGGDGRAQYSPRR